MNTLAVETPLAERVAETLRAALYPSSKWYATGQRFGYKVVPRYDGAVVVVEHTADTDFDETLRAFETCKRYEEALRRDGIAATARKDETGWPYVEVLS